MFECRVEKPAVTYMKRSFGGFILFTEADKQSLSGITFFFFFFNEFSLNLIVDEVKKLSGFITPPYIYIFILFNYIFQTWRKTQSTTAEHRAQSASILQWDQWLEFFSSVWRAFILLSFYIRHLKPASAVRRESKWNSEWRKKGEDVFIDIPASYSRRQHRSGHRKTH